jgi:hypothetical protein
VIDGPHIRADLGAEEKAVNRQKATVEM